MHAMPPLGNLLIHLQTDQAKATQQPIFQSEHSSSDLNGGYRGAAVLPPRRGVHVVPGRTEPVKVVANCLEVVSTASRNLPGLKRLSDSLSQSSRDTDRLSPLLRLLSKKHAILTSMKHGRQSTTCPEPRNVALSSAVAASSGCTSRS